MVGWSHGEKRGGGGCDTSMVGSARIYLVIRVQYISYGHTDDEPDSADPVIGIYLIIKF